MTNFDLRRVDMHFRFIVKYTNFIQIDDIFIGISILGIKIHIR